MRKCEEVLICFNSRGGVRCFCSQARFRTRNQRDIPALIKKVHEEIMSFRSTSAFVGQLMKFQGNFFQASLKSIFC